METKDQLLRFFLSGHIKLSEYDYKFMANLLSMTEKNNTITSNQDDLFTKLTSKYKRQLASNLIPKEKVQSLEWTFPVIPSSSEYTSAYLYIENDLLKLRSPFNKNFISYFGQKVENNSFRWDKAQKLYVSEFSTSALKIAYDALPKFYKAIRYCDALGNIIAELEKYDELIHNPTLKLVNGRVYLIAANEFVLAAAEKVGFNIDANTLYKLSILGIEVDGSITNNNRELEFASQYHYKHDLLDITTLVKYIENIDNCKVVMGRGMRFDRGAMDKIAKMFSNTPVQVMPNYNISEDDKDVILLQIGEHKILPLYANYANRITKVISLTDSTPVKIK